MVVYLIGFMGTGKSVVGLKLSRKLNIPLLDMDDEIVRRDGRSIPEIFAQDGEDAFRDMEEALLREIADSDKDLIVSCGGGDRASGGESQNSEGESIYGSAFSHAADDCEESRWRP